jgi:ribosome biogenesis GTPase A
MKTLQSSRWAAWLAVFWFGCVSVDHSYVLRPQGRVLSSLQQRNMMIEMTGPNESQPIDKKKASLKSRILKSRNNLIKEDIVMPKDNPYDTIPEVNISKELQAYDLYDNDQVGEQKPGFKSGFVSILGNPNVGKSTLLNALLGQKLSIVSPKPQTTRHRIFGVLTEPTYQIVFCDTPGMLNPVYSLQETMQDVVSQYCLSQSQRLSNMSCIYRYEEQ